MTDRSDASSSSAINSDLVRARIDLRLAELKTLAARATVDHGRELDDTAFALVLERLKHAVRQAMKRSGFG